MPPISLVALAQNISQKGYLWTQGAGGNVSEKQGDHLWVKASGFRLDQIGPEKGLSVVNLPKIRSGLESLVHTPDEKTYSELLRSCVVQGETRPSMETGLHAELPGRYVAHFHSVISVLMASQHQQNAQKFTKWYRENWEKQLGTFVVLPLVMPGLQLAKQFREHRSASVLFLESHGVVVQSNETIDLKLFSQFEINFCESFGFRPILDFYYRMKEPDLKAPIRFLYPDFAIVFDQLFPFLQKEGDLFFPLDDLSLSLLEIWQAHCFLNQFGSELQELPKPFVDALVDLPTEQFRRGVKLQ